MQAAKDAAASMKKKAANIGASAQAGMEKTKATMLEKVDKAKAHDEREKQIAHDRKQEKVHEAEAHRQEAQENNAAGKEAKCRTTKPAIHGTGIGYC